MSSEAFLDIGKYALEVFTFWAVWQIYDLIRTYLSKRLSKNKVEKLESST